MKDDKKNKIINSFIISAIVAIIFIPISVILGELYKPFKDWLKNIFYHHWIGKGVIAFVIFYFFGFLKYFKSKDNEDVIVKMLKVLFWITFIGTLAIISFYLYEYFIVH